MYISTTEKQGGGKLMFMPFEIVSIIMCVALVLFSETCGMRHNLLNSVLL